MSKTCDICEHLANPSNTIFATDRWVVALAADQGYLGRCYVTVREHTGELGSLHAEAWAEFGTIAKRLEEACKKAFGATPFNWACMMNNAYQTEPAEPHVHWHFRPRYKQPVTLHGITFDDPLFGHHYDREQRRQVDEKTFQVILAAIKSNL